MGLDDFVSHSQAEAQADVAGGEKGFGGLARGLGAETGPAVLHFNLRPARPAGIGFGAGADLHLAGLGVGLEGVEDDLGKGVLQSLPVAGDVNGSPADSNCRSTVVEG